SISSAFATRYLGPSTFIGTKLHFIPVLKPAPPLPLRLDSFTSAVTSGGVMCRIALRAAWYPPTASYWRSPNGGKVICCVSGRSMSGIFSENVFQCIRRQVAVQVLVHHHGGRMVAGTEAWIGK